MFSSRTNWSLAPNRLSEAILERRRRGLPVFDLAESNPTRSGFASEPQEVLAALADPASLTYAPDPRGLRVAREGVAAYYAERGAEVDPDQIFLTSSTSEAYSYAFRLLADAGERVLVPRPSYPLFEFLARLDDVGLTPYPLVYDHEWRIDTEALGARLLTSGAGSAEMPRTARAILVVHPNNPTGSFVHADELVALADLCHRHDVALVADEVFADYGFAAGGPGAGVGSRVPTFAATADVLTFTLSGLSKLSALPQMKLAWIVVSGPGDARRAALERLEVIADTYLSVSAPLACALPKWLELGRRVRPQILERVRRNLRFLDGELAPESPASRLATEGGWYAILRIPATRADDDWAVELVASDGVLVHPGHFYDFATDGYLVLSLLAQPETFESGVRKLLARISQTG